MTWARFDDSFLDHPKTELVLDSVGPVGMWLHVAAICWCVKHATNGRITEAKVRDLARGADHVLLSNALVAARSWKRTKTGFAIHDFLDYQPSAKTVKERRDAARDRKRVSRASHKDVTRDTNVTSRTRTRAQPRAGSGWVVAVVDDEGTDAITRATAILATVWPDVDPVGVENAAAGDPDADLVAAARLAGVWGSDANWSMGAAASLRSAMRKLKAENAGGRSKAERQAAGLSAFANLERKTA